MAEGLHTHWTGMPEALVIHRSEGCRHGFRCAEAYEEEELILNLEWRLVVWRLCPHHHQNRCRWRIQVWMGSYLHRLVLAEKAPHLPLRKYFTSEDVHALSREHRWSAVTRSGRILFLEEKRWQIFRQKTGCTSRSISTSRRTINWQTLRGWQAFHSRKLCGQSNTVGFVQETFLRVLKHFTPCVLHWETYYKPPHFTQMNYEAGMSIENVLLGF